MNVCEMLNEYGKIQELIGGKKEERKQLIQERDRLIAIATDISAKMPDGMPFDNTGVVSQKMENAVIAKILIDKEIERIEDAIAIYLEAKNKVITAIEKLPTQQYGVLHRFYIRGMTYEKIAEDMGISTVQVWRIKKKAEKTFSDVVECNA